MSFVSDKKKVEIMLKNVEAFSENERTLFGSKCHEVAAKFLISKNK